MILLPVEDNVLLVLPGKFGPPNTAAAAAAAAAATAPLPIPNAAAIGFKEALINFQKEHKTVFLFNTI